MALNPYDEEVEQRLGAAPPPATATPAKPKGPPPVAAVETTQRPQAPPSDVVDGFDWAEAARAARAQEEFVIRQSLGTAQKTPPDRAGKILQLQGATGLPADYIDRNFDRINSGWKESQTPIGEILRSAPALASTLADPIKAAAVQHDLAPLFSLERLTQEWHKGVLNYYGAIYGAESGVLWALGAVADIGARYERRTARLAATIMGPERAAATLGPAFEEAALFTPAAARLHEMARSSAAVSKELFKDYRPGSGLEEMAWGGFQSLVQQGPLVGFSAVGAGVALTKPTLKAIASSAAAKWGLAFMGIQTGGSAYGEAVEEGLSLNDALVYAGAVGAVNIATEHMPANRYVKDLFEGAGFFKIVGGQIATEMGGEQLSTAIEDLARWAAIEQNHGKTFGDYLIERPTAIAATAVGTVVAAGGMGASGYMTQVILDRFRATAETTKAFETSPEVVREILTKAFADNSTKTLYVGFDEWTKYWTDLGHDPAAELTKLTGDANSYEDARKAKTKVAFPTTEYALQLMTTDHHTFFRDEASAGHPDAPNARQADAMEAARTTTAAKIGASVKAAAAGETTGLTDRQRELRDKLAAQMLSDDQFHALALRAQTDPTYAATMTAAAVAPFIETLAENLQRDPVALMESAGLVIGRNGVSFNGTTFNQDRILAHAEQARIAATESAAFKEFFGQSQVTETITRPDGTTETVPRVVYHSGTFDETEGVPIIGAMHFGTLDAARDRIGTREIDAWLADLDVSQDSETGRWHWESGIDESFAFNEDGYDSAAEARAAAEDFSRGIESSDEDVPITAAYLSIQNPKRVADQVTPEGWAAAIEQAKAEGHDGLVYRNEFEDKGRDSYVAFDATQVKSVNNRGTFDRTSDNVLQQAAPLPRSFLRRVAPFLLPSDKPNANTAQLIVEAFDEITSVETMADAARAARIKKGWYKRAKPAIEAVFGVDAYRFTALLAGMSPRVEVHANLLNALNIWTAWLEADKPGLKHTTEPKAARAAIVALMAKHVRGGRGEKSILPSWINNTVAVLTAPTDADIKISGPKVNPFQGNLLGRMEQVTTDAWAVLFSAIWKAINGADIGVTGHAAIAAKTRAAAVYLTDLTGEEWSPAEVQETSWCWIKTLYDFSKKEKMTAEQFLRAGKLTDEAIAQAPEFATLLARDATIREILEHAGYGAVLNAFEASGGLDASLRASVPSTGEVREGPRGEIAPVTPSLLALAARIDEIRTGRRFNTRLNKHYTDLIARASDPTTGGFTFDLAGNKPAEAGHAVSIGVAVTLPAGKPPSVAGLTSFAARHTALLQKKGYALGAWRDPETGAITYDVVRIVKDRDAALRVAQGYDQQTVFDLSKPSAAAGGAVPVAYQKGHQHGDHWTGPGGPNAVEGAPRTVPTPGGDAVAAGSRRADRAANRRATEPSGSQVSRSDLGRVRVLKQSAVGEAAGAEAEEQGEGAPVATTVTLYQEPAPLPSARKWAYSRLVLAVKTAKPEKARGKEWQSLIRGAKTGVNEDEFLYAGPDDLEPEQVYERQEVLDWLALNEVKVTWTVLAGEGIDQHWVARRTDEIFEARVQKQVDRADEWGTGLQYERARVTYDEETEEWAVPGPHGFDGFPTREEAEQAAMVENDRREDLAHADLVQEVRNSLNYDDARDEAVNEYIATYGDLSPKYTQYQLDGGTTAEPGSEREVFLQARADARHWGDGHEKYDDIENPIIRLRFNVRAEVRVVAQRELDQAIMQAAIDAEVERHRLQLETHAHDRTPEQHEAIRVQTRLVNAGKREMTAAAGHTEKTGRRFLFIEEIQPPSEDNAALMPLLFSKNGYQLGLKWALHYAAQEGLDGVSMTTGEQQADRWALSQFVEKIAWAPPLKALDQDVGYMKGRVESATDRIVDLERRLAHLGALTKAEQQELRHAKLLVAGMQEPGLRRVMFHHRDGFGGAQGTYAMVRPDGHVIYASEAHLIDKRLSQIIGSTVAEKILAGPATGELASPEDIDIGDKKVENLYNHVLPAIWRKLPLIKRHGVTQTTITIDRQRHQARPTRANEPWITESDQPAIAFTPDLKAAILAGETYLFQEGEAPGTHRAEITLGAAFAHLKFTERSDLSSYLHEFAHLYLQMLKNVTSDLAARDPLSLSPGERRVVKDWEAMLAWFKVSSSLEVGDAQQEQLATSIEAYLRRGNAPSRELVGVFAQFQSWLVKIYKTEAEIGATVALNEEITDLFSRLAASEDAVLVERQQRALQALFTTAEDAKMQQIEWQGYQSLVTAAHAAADARLEARAKAELTREAQAWWRAKRTEIAAELTASYQVQPAYVALRFLQHGEQPTGEPAPAAFKISKASIEARYGKDRLKTLPRPYVYTTSDEGIDVEAAAELLGFSSGDDLLTTLSTTEPLKARVARETRALMVAQYGAMLEDGTLQRKARQAVEEGGHDAIAVAELKALRRAAEAAAPIVRGVVAQQTAEEASARRAATAALRAATVTPEEIRETARRQIEKTAPKDLQPHLFWSAAQSAALRAQKALVAGNYEAAVTAKEEQRMALALHREAIRAEDEVAAIYKYARRLQQEPAQARLGTAGESYQAQVNHLLNKYEFADISNAALDRRQSLVKWVAERQAEGYPIIVPAEVLEAAQQTNYRQATIKTLRDVRDTIRQIESLARLKNDLLTSKDRRDFKAKKAALIASLQANNAQRAPQAEVRGLDKALLPVQQYFAKHAKLAEIAQSLDGYKDGGPMWDLFVRPANTAANEEQTRFAAAGEAINAILSKHYPRREASRLRAMVKIPELGYSLSREAIIAVALNWGNESSRKRVLSQSTAHRRWLPNQVHAILDQLDQRDWDFVQDVWDHVNTYWQEVSDKHFRMNGIRPEKVEALPVETKFGTYRGGYYPLAYDHRLSSGAQTKVLASDADFVTAGAHLTLTTRNGHEEARVEHVELPIRLELGVLFEHVNQVIHSLTHHEMIVDVSRLLRDRQVLATLDERAGPVIVAQLRGALIAIANGTNAGNNNPDRALNYMRKGQIIAGLGLNMWTTAQQPFGIFNGAARIGPKWMARGMAAWLGDAVTMQNTLTWIHRDSAFMRHRHQQRDQDLSELRNRLSAPGNWFDTLVRSMTSNAATAQTITDGVMWQIGMMQRVADVPTWLGQFEKSKAAGRSHEEAVAEADQAVRDSQGGGQIVDLAEIQRGGDLMKAILMFYSYGNVTYGQSRRAYRQTRWRNPVSVARFLGNLSLIYMLPAAGTILLGHAVGLRAWDVDEDKWEQFFKEVGIESLSSWLNGLLWFREVRGLIDTDSRYPGPTFTRIFRSFWNLRDQALQGELDGPFWKAFAETVGPLFHVPATQIQRTLDGAVAMAEGETINPLVLLYGSPKEPD